MDNKSQVVSLICGSRGVNQCRLIWMRTNMTRAPFAFQEALGPQAGGTSRRGPRFSSHQTVWGRGLVSMVSLVEAALFGLSIAPAVVEGDL